MSVHLEGVRIVHSMAVRTFNADWLGISDHPLTTDVLGRNARVLAEIRLQAIRQGALHLPPAVVGERTRSARLLFAREALYLRELLRRDEEARRLHSWGDDEALRRWPDRDALWLAVACEKCDFTREREAEIDAEYEAAREGPIAGWQAAEERRDAQTHAWRVCQGRVVMVRRRALWEQTTGACVHFLFEVRDAAIAATKAAA